MASDYDRNNPYAAPVEIPSQASAPLTRNEAVRRLRTPAVLLTVSATASLLWGSVALFTGSGPLRRADFSSASFLVGTLVILVVLPIIVIGSAALVAQGNVRMWPWIAIASGLIPLGTGCVCGNLVFAFWLLHLMLRKDIRAALASPEIALESKRTR